MDDRLRRRALVVVAVVVATLFLAGCGAASPSSPPSAAVGPGGSTAGTPAVTPAPPAPTGPLALISCHDGEECPVDAGSYVTEGPYAFMPGLAITIPAGWFLTEQDNGELSIRPNDHRDSVLFLWKDLDVIVSSHRTAPAGTVVPAAGATPESIVRWFTTNPDFRVLAAPKAAKLAGGTTGTVLDLGISKTANYGDPDCPGNPRCADLFKDVIHWGNNFYGIGGLEVIRLFVATVEYPTGNHIFLMAMDVPSADALKSFATEAQPIIDSLRLPETWFAN